MDSNAIISDGTGETWPARGKQNVIACRSMLDRLLCWTCLACLASCAFACSDEQSAGDNFLIGTGKADITGPLVDVPFSGYVRPTHIASGVHTRLGARAFIIGELEGDRRLAFVSADLLNTSHEVRLSVVDNLRAKYGELYSLDNVVLSATHTHSSPGGYSHDGAFREAYFEAVVRGITQALEAAHEDLRPGRILIGQSEVEGAGVNRSRVAYLQNPESERSRYGDDTDRTMTLLKLQRDDGVLGVLSWFAVHPTTLTFNNPLVSADHKGFAALEMEARLRERDDTADDVVAAFAQSNCGDVTGNLNLDNTGPGVDDYDSARIIGERQLDAAMEIYESASEALREGVDYRLAAVDFTDLEVRGEFTGSGAQQTCFPAWGYSFAAGSTEDGGGHPLFVEGMLERNETIDLLTEAVVQPPPISDELRACHAPKPILYPKAQQDPLPIGVAKLGQLALVFIPSEATTMSGRRMRDTIRSVFGDEVKHVVIAGYSNDYAGYITTPEEYAAQQYEGGHTLFGPWTLPAFQQELDRLARAIAEQSALPAGPDQGDLRDTVDSSSLGNEFDEPPQSASFGDIATPPDASYAQGATMAVSFWTGHPDNALRPDAPYVEIQRLVDSSWSTVATEANWSTQVQWAQQSRVIPPYDPLDPFAAPPPPINEAFTVSIRWQIPSDAEPGSYRVLFHGSELRETELEPRAFTAQSPEFTVETP